MGKLKELKKAQKYLQQAHDYIETHSFDIGEYLGAEPIKGSKPAGCYIGTMRHIAKLNPDPDFDSDLYDEAPTANGDAALEQAFKVLDRVIERDLDQQRKNRVMNEYSGAALPGRYVEAFGFQVLSDINKRLSAEMGPSAYYDDVDEYERRKHQAEAHEALLVFRKALTEIYYEIERLEIEKAAKKADK